jgi:hypothetical protein
MAVGLVFQLLQPLSLMLVALVWLGPAAWMYRDAGLRMRGPDRPLQALVAGAALPFVAPLAWALLRPPETLEEREERELTRRHLERLLEPEERCLVCRTPVAGGFLCCPTCGTELRRRCSECEKPVEFTWSVCPYCGARAGEDARVVQLTA